MAVPNDLRQMNRRQVVLRCLRGGAVTRSDLARETGLSQPTTGKIVDALIADGVLRPVGRAAGNPPAPGRPGRPGHALKLDDVRPRFLAVQLGPVHTRLAALTVAPPAGGDAWAAVIRTPPSLPRWTAAVADAARSLRPATASATATAPPLDAVFVSLPGVLDPATGVTLLSPNVRWMEGHAVAAALGHALAIPAHPVQEIDGLARGHRVAGPAAAAAADDFLLVDFGIGVGSAAVIGGQLFRGGLPFAGELGHTPVPGHAAPCGCGGRGCLETLVGRRHLLGPDGTAAPSTGDRADRIQVAMAAAGLGIAAALNVLGLNHVIVTGFVADLPPASFGVLRDAVAAAAVAGRFGSAVRTEPARRHRLAGLATVAIDRVIAPP